MSCGVDPSGRRARRKGRVEHGELCVHRNLGGREGFRRRLRRRVHHGRCIHCRSRRQPWPNKKSLIPTQPDKQCTLTAQGVRNPRKPAEQKFVRGYPLD